jgi:muramoyltetrapeptide carboxypeptidase LdcA involved in peptidoglycan recycling
VGWSGRYPDRYAAGKRQFEQKFGCRVIETRNALRDAAWIAANPKARADDLMEAFTDKSIRAVIDGWSAERLEWDDPANQSRRRALTPSTGWRWLQGTGRVAGPLIGGCIDVMEWLKGTAVWPQREVWAGAVLFLETSEEAPSALHVRRWLRSYGVQGILDSVAAILVGRPGGHELPVATHKEYDDAVLGVVRDEFGLATPIIAGMDFGHTDPFFVLPYGVNAEIDCDARRFSFAESAGV